MFLIWLTKSSSGKGTACIGYMKPKKKCGMIEVESGGRKRQRVQAVLEVESEVRPRSRSMGRKAKGKQRAEVESELEVEAETEKEVEGWRLVLGKMKQLEEWVGRMEVKLGGIEKVLEKIPIRVLTGVMTCQGTPNPILAPWPFSVHMLCLEAFPSMTFL